MAENQLFSHEPQAIHEEPSVDDFLDRYAQTIASGAGWKLSIRHSAEQLCNSEGQDPVAFIQASMRSSDPQIRDRTLTWIRGYSAVYFGDLSEMTESADRVFAHLAEQQVN